MINEFLFLSSADVHSSQRAIVNKPKKVPKHISLKRESICFCIPKHILGKCQSSTVLLAKYEGIDVAVKQFKKCSSIEVVLKEVHLFLKLGPHESLPMLIGIAIEEKPFLIVWKFYGTKKGMTSTTLSIGLQCIGEKKLPSSKWVRVIIKIARGIDYLHQKGYLHGNIEESHVLIQKADDGHINPKLVGLGSCQEFNVNDTDAKDQYLQEMLHLGSLLGEIYKRLSNKHPSTTYILGRALNDNAQKHPSAIEIAKTFQEVLESGHFDS